MADKNLVKGTTSLVMETGKAAVIGAILRGLGQRVAGDIGDAVGGCVAGAIIKGNLGQTVALISVMDATHNLFGAGGAQAARKKTVSRREV
jgi:hypothetical protein